MSWFLEAGTWWEDCKVCCECFHVLPYVYFSRFAGTRDKHATICKRCMLENLRTLARLRCENPRPRHGPCDTCGIPCQYELDHCHETHTFRGYVCKSCNRRARRPSFRWR